MDSERPCDLPVVCLHQTLVLKRTSGICLVVPSAGGTGSIPGQGTRSHMPQLRVGTPQLKIPYAAVRPREAKYINIER